MLYYQCQLSLRQGCTEPGRTVAVPTKFCTVVPNICGSSVWIFLHVTLYSAKFLCDFRISGKSEYPVLNYVTNGRFSSSVDILNAAIETYRAGIDRNVVRRRLCRREVRWTFGLEDSANGDRPICIEKCGGISESPAGVGQARSKNNSEATEGL